MELLPDADITATVNVAMQEASNGEGDAYFKNICYTKPKVPTLWFQTSTRSCRWGIFQQTPKST
ncbi:hypothetical protein N7520_007134 [Penicillium odoratum]|uniref:uncharacterized protein n=1 Tax=Penicillium odoratum TaxID=1167516 RepID=UPI0025493C0B|nr:uncharacterized protein N7520_007134 [Penicillium odoratum]KAJ5759978.1 hypothetical protein N7520_007134 [Penicillium odoratum]